MRSVATRLKSRLFISHLMITIAILFILALVIFTKYYPYPYYHVLDIVPIFLIVVLLLFIFPLLTIYINDGKRKTLKLDFTIILFLQIAVLLGSVYALAQLRPAWIVLNMNKLHIVRPIDIRDKNNGTYKMPILKQPWNGPTFYHVSKPTDPNDLKFIREANFYGAGAMYPEFYKSLESKQLQNSQWSIDKIYDNNLIKRIYRQYPNANYYVPIVGIDGQDMALVVYDKADKLLGYVLP